MGLTFSPGRLGWHALYSPPGLCVCAHVHAQAPSSLGAVCSEPHRDGSSVGGGPPALSGPAGLGPLHPRLTPGPLQSLAD